MVVVVHFFPLKSYSINCSFICGVWPWAINNMLFSVFLAMVFPPWMTWMCPLICSAPFSNCCRLLIRCTKCLCHCSGGGSGGAGCVFPQTVCRSWRPQPAASVQVWWQEQSIVPSVQDWAELLRTQPLEAFPLHYDMPIGCKSFVKPSHMGCWCLGAWPRLRWDFGPEASACSAIRSM